MKAESGRRSYVEWSGTHLQGREWSEWSNDGKAFPPGGEAAPWGAVVQVHMSADVAHASTEGPCTYPNRCRIPLAVLYVDLVDHGPRRSNACTQLLRQSQSFEPTSPSFNPRALQWWAHQSFSVPMRSPCALLEHSVHEWCRAEEWRPCPPPSETGRRWPRWPLDHATSRSSSFV